MRVFAMPKTADVTCIALAPDGSRLAAGGKKAGVRVWNLHSGSARPEFALTGTKGARFVGFAGNAGALVVAGSYHSPAARWDLAALTSRPLGPPPDYCHDTAVSPDGVQVVRAEARIHCRDAADGRRLWSTPRLSGYGIRPLVRFDAAVARLVVVGKRVSIRDAGTGAEVGASP